MTATVALRDSGTTTGPWGHGRQVVREAVLRRPGLHKTGLCQETGLAWGTVAYHLASLLRGNELEQVRLGKEAHVFAPHTPVGHRAWIALLRSPEAERVVRHIAERREATVADLVAALPSSRRAVVALLERLRACDLVVPLTERRRRFTLGAGWAAVRRHAGSYGLDWVRSLTITKAAALTRDGAMLVPARAFAADARALPAPLEAAA
jgi:DNA-binding transcriptional ArsR family regulator